MTTLSTFKRRRVGKYHERVNGEHDESRGSQWVEVTFGQDHEKSIVAK